MEPMFTHRLTRTDVHARLTWPSKHWRVLNHVTMDLNHSSDGSRMQFQVYDMESQCYRTLTCTTRKTGDHRKPVISGGWTRFIEENGLQENDEITFYRNMDPLTGRTFVERPFTVQVTMRVN